MQAEIEHLLRKIIGMPMFSIGRASNTLWTSFGTRRVVTTRLGRTKEVGDYAIHIQCSWRITKHSKVLVASHDLYVPSSSWTGDDDDFNWNAQRNNLFDERIHELFQPGKAPVVTGIHADCCGGFKIAFTKQLVLEAFPNSSDDAESWRMFVPGNTEEHLVVSNNGIST